jgi:hypothetical protein
MRVLTMLSKTFLHLWYLPHISGDRALFDVWVKILMVLGHYRAVGGEAVGEAVQEHVKNMILVMKASGVFSSPHLTTSSREDEGEDAPNLWTKSFDMVRELCPGLVVTLHAIEHSSSSSASTTSSSTAPSASGSSASSPVSEDDRSGSSSSVSPSCSSSSTSMAEPSSTGCPVPLSPLPPAVVEELTTKDACAVKEQAHSGDATDESSAVVATDALLSI